MLTATHWKLMVIICLALVASACQKSEEKAKPGPGAESSAAGATEKPVGAAVAPVEAEPNADLKTEVVLLEPGVEPRKELRYRFETGAVEKLSIYLTQKMKIEVPGMPSQPVEVPTMKMDMTLEIVEALAENEVRYKYELVAAGLVDPESADPMMVSALRAQLGNLVGISGTSVVDDRGFNRDVTLDLPDSLDGPIRQMVEGTKQSIEQMSSPLPAEAVGVGAKWRVQKTILQNGLKLGQVANYELKARDGDTARVSVTLTQSAEKQKAALPGLPPGVDVEVVSLASTGSGELEIHIGKLSPRKSSMALQSKSEFDVGAGPGKPSQSMKMDMDLSMKFEGN